MRVPRDLWAKIVAMAASHRRSAQEELATVLERGLKGSAAADLASIVQTRIENFNREKST